MSEPRLLSIDVGTQSARAIVFDAQGRLLAKAQEIFEPTYLSPQPGWAEQDPEVYWRGVAACCRRLWEQGAVRPEDISGISLTTQRATVVCVDAAGQVLRPAILWLDQRRCERPPPMGPVWNTLFGLAGATDLIGHLQGQAEANWLAQHEPQLWRDTAKFLLLSGWLSYRLTGEFVDSVGSQVGFIPFDYKRLDWAGTRDFKWKALAIRPQQLPRLVPPGAPMGRLSAAAAAELGLPADVPVISAAADKACEVLGCGVLEPDVGQLSFGTTATINTTQSRYIEVQRMLPPWPAGLPQAYNTEIQIFRGFWMVSWFRREFAHREEALAAERGVAVESLFDELVKTVPPGSMGLMLQPYWTPGIRVPGREAKGAIIGFGDVHTRAHVYRAILEGLAYALREGKERIERRAGTRMTELRVSGGGSQSDAAMQLTADIFGLPTSRPHVYETSGLGAAIDAAVGLGLYPDFGAAIRGMTRVGRVFEPIAANQAVYERLYREVYLQMYRRLQPMYRDIARITGYPQRV